MPKISPNNHVLIPKLVPIDNLIVNNNFMRMKFTKLLFKTCALIFFTFMLGINISEAQTWDALTLKGSTLTTGTTYYVYNVGSNGYLNRGGMWSTMAVVTASPTANASAEIIKWTAENTTRSTECYNCTQLNAFLSTCKSNAILNLFRNSYDFNWYRSLNQF
jgi:hypothetical protein